MTAEITKMKLRRKCWGSLPAELETIIRHHSKKNYTKKYLYDDEKMKIEKS